MNNSKLFSLNNSFKSFGESYMMRGVTQVPEDR
jgi:hypothetical protein